MFENPRRGRQARNFTTNVPKIRDLKSSENCRWVPLKQREIELNCDISTGQYQSSSGLLRYHEFTKIYME